MTAKTFSTEDKQELTKSLSLLKLFTDNYIRALENDDIEAIQSIDLSWEASASTARNFAIEMFDRYENGEFSIVGEVIERERNGENK